MPNRHVLPVNTRSSGERAHHDFAGVHSHASFDWRVPVFAQFGRIALHFILHPQRSIECALRMVFVSDRRPEEREDTVAGGLGDVTAIALDAGLRAGSTRLILLSQCSVAMGERSQSKS